MTHGIWIGPDGTAQYSQTCAPINSAAKIATVQIRRIHHHTTTTSDAPYIAHISAAPNSINNIGLVISSSRRDSDLGGGGQLLFRSGENDPVVMLDCGRPSCHPLSSSWQCRSGQLPAPMLAPYSVGA